MAKRESAGQSRRFFCPPCLVSLPAYDRMLALIGSDDFASNAINVDEHTENGLLFLQDTPVSYPVIADPEGEIGIPYGIRSLPVSFLPDQAGTSWLPTAMSLAWVAKLRYFYTNQ